MGEGLGDGNVVEVLHLVELLYNFQISLQCLDLGVQILGDLLDGFVPGEEVKYLVDISAKYVNTAELFDQFYFKLVPIGDVVEGSPLVCWDALNGDEESGRVGALGEVETMQGGGQPWIEVVGSATPLVSVGFRRFKAGMGWWGRL